MGKRENEMAIKMAVRKLVAQENLRRADTGEPSLTQQRLAEMSGVTQSVISTIMSGKIKRIDLKTINGLCNSLKVKPGDLFEYTPDQETEAKENAATRHG